MEEKVLDQELHLPWPDLNSHSYGDIPIEEPTTDLSTSDFSSVYRQHHLQHSHLHHHHVSQQQPQHVLDHQILRSPSISYITQPRGSYRGIPEAETAGHFKYGNDTVPGLISKPVSEMRTGLEAAVNVEGEEAGKKGFKRKRGDINMEACQQNKMDASQRCDVCGEQASGHYFGALVCLPCKSFFIRCTKEGRPNFNNQCGGTCDVLKGGRVRCQHCRFQKCIQAGMYRKEKPEAVEPAEGQMLCKVCGDIANGVHFGVTTCEGCKKFFRRGLKENRTYNCKGNMHCSINPRMRNNCRFCRYQKCLYEGMSREAIKMGRPKKGELSYRKSLKRNGIKQTMNGFYGNQISEVNRFSLSSESDVEEETISPSSDVYDLMPTAQHQQMQSELNGHIQHLNSQHQQQSGTFSLGSILHDCMTVRDWDHKVEMPDLEIVPSQSAVTLSVSSSSGNSQSIMDEGGHVSPHTRRTSPILLSDMLGRQLQHQQFHNNHQQQSLHVKDTEQLQESLQPRRQIATYHEHNSDFAVKMAASSGINSPNEHTFSFSRAIKIEKTSFHSGSGDSYEGDDILNDVKHFQPFSKVNFHTYHMQNIHPDLRYGVSKDVAVSSPPSGGMILPVSQIETSVGLQTEAISSQDMLYGAHQHQKPIIVRNISQHKQGNDLPQNRRSFENSDMDKASIYDNPHRDQTHEIKFATELFPQAGHQTIPDHRITRTAQDPTVSPSQSRTTNVSLPARNTFSQAFNSKQPQCGSQTTRVSTDNRSNLVFESLKPRTDSGEFEDSFTNASFGGRRTTTSVPTSVSASSSDTLVSAHHKHLGIKNPIAAILQYHRDALQAGRPIHLSSEDVEELLHTLSNEQQRSQGYQINENIVASEQTTESDQFDFKGQSTETFLIQNQPAEELVHRSKQTPPTAENFEGNNQTSQYTNISVNNESISEINRRHCQNQRFPCSDSSSIETTEILTTGFINNNNNNNINNNDIINNKMNHINHYTACDTYNTPNNQNGARYDFYEDSFNSALIRDSMQLHEINKIFLSINNSCEANGCNCSNSAIEDSGQENEAIVSCMSADDFSPKISHRYWHSFRPSQRFVLLNPDKQKIIQEVLEAFDDLQKTCVINEPEYFNKKMPLDHLEHWHHIQRRIARHVVAGQRFCRNIPGYFKLDIQDRISLGKHVGFGLMVLIACTEFYDPESKCFKHIWNWTVPMDNPLFSYKVHLLSLGDRIHDIKVDRTEAAMMCAVSMTSIDCPNLLKPEIVCVVRDVLIDALKAHLITKTNSTLRLNDLMNIMPQVRLMTVWYNNLMKKMSLPSDIINSKINNSTVRESDNATHIT